MDDKENEREGEGEKEIKNAYIHIMNINITTTATLYNIKMGILEWLELEFQSPNNWRELNKLIESI